ncbi:hypothetical protein [Streptomyces olivochromogenes]|nr:hypothetical protein [Streptomyces olivochromogenes]
MKADDTHTPARGDLVAEGVVGSTDSLDAGRQAPSTTTLSGAARSA